MNRVLLTGRLTREPELRTTAAGKTVVQFSVATHEYIGGGKEKSEFHDIVAWVLRPLGRTSANARPASRRETGSTAPSSSPATTGGA
ncbi:MAG: single-stranded DNA-binding protein [Candidatus Limnocylindrales bacterium]